METTTLLTDWLEVELAHARRWAQRALGRAEALAALLNFARDAEAELGERVSAEDLLGAARATGGERRRAEVAVWADAVGSPLPPMTDDPEPPARA